MKKLKKVVIFLSIMIIGLFLIQCSGEKNLTIVKSTFGEVDGKAVDLYTMQNVNGIKVAISNYGGTIISVETPDKDGKFADIVVGHNDFDGMMKQTSYFGPLIGRFANRIAKGKFSLDGKEYTLAVNNEPNTLHGGIKGFDKNVWDAEIIKRENATGIKLTYVSPDGEEGYPGEVTTVVNYLLTNDDELKIEYSATTDAKTIINLTNHTYWNLSQPGTILDHKMMINADKTTPVDETLIPTGELTDVKATALDFTIGKLIGKDIKNECDQLKYGNNGYDHNWVLNKDKDGKLTLAMSLYDAESGRILEMHTTEPGLQFYSGNFLDGTIVDKNGYKLQKHDALVIEAQHFPDSPNQPNFPNTILLPGEEYTQTTILKFMTINK